MPTDIVIAQTTVDSGHRAAELARGAVESGLAACAHVDAPHTAVYRWEGTVETATEWRVSFKTTRSRLPALTARVTGEHPYDVPEWIVLAVDSASAAYAAWITRETEPE